MNMNFIKISLELLHTTQPNIMANKNINFDLSPTKTIIRCLNIQIYPYSIQNKYLNNCLGVYRLVYNITIKYIKKHKKPILLL